MMLKMVNADDDITSIMLTKMTTSPPSQLKTVRDDDKVDVCNLLFDDDHDDDSDDDDKVGVCILLADDDSDADSDDDSDDDDKVDVCILLAAIPTITQNGWQPQMH